MSIGTEEKKNVTTTWLNEFHELTAYSQVKFYKILGPVILGIDIIKLPRSDEYRPYFVIYPLWNNSEGECLEMALISYGINRENGRQLDIPFKDHDKWKDEAFECTRKQTIPFDRNISLPDFLDFVISAMEKGFGVPVEIANNYELRLFAAVYVGDWTRTEQILNELYDVGSPWPAFGFDHIFGPFNQWYKNLEERVRNREKFLEQIKLNLSAPKFSKLKRSELLP